MSRREPVFNVPGAVLATLAVLAAVHAARQILSVDEDDWLVWAMAFVPARYGGASSEFPGGVVATYASPVTHMLVHGSWSHLLLNGASLLAFGGGLARRIGGARFVLFSLYAGSAGALLFWLLNQGHPLPMVGASGAIAGMMGATMRYFFAALDEGGFGQLREAPQSVPLMPLGTALTDRRVLLATGVFLALNLLAFFGFGAPEDSGGIAWEAHVGGYLAGLLGFGLFDPGDEGRSHSHNIPKDN